MMDPKILLVASIFGVIVMIKYVQSWESTGKLFSFFCKTSNKTHVVKYVKLHCLDASAQDSRTTDKSIHMDKYDVSISYSCMVGRHGF